MFFTLKSDDLVTNSYIFDTRWRLIPRESISALDRTVAYRSLNGLINGAVQPVFLDQLISNMWSVKTEPKGSEPTFSRFLERFSFWINWISEAKSGKYYITIIPPLAYASVWVLYELENCEVELYQVEVYQVELFSNPIQSNFRPTKKFWHSGWFFLPHDTENPHVAHIVATIF